MRSLYPRSFCYGRECVLFLGLQGHSMAGRGLYLHLHGAMVEEQCNRKALGRRKRGEERREDINFCLTLAATSPYNGMAHCNKSNLLSLQANLI